MRPFTLYIEDSRYSVPTLVFVTVSHAERAREIAAEQLSRSDHHLAVELYEGETLIERIAREQAQATTL